jgi:hypothetical protein
MLRDTTAEENYDPWGNFGDYEDQDQDKQIVEEEGILPSVYDIKTVRYPIRVQSD